MSRSFSSMRLPDTRRSPPTSTSTPFPFPSIDAMPPTSRELNERSALLSNFPPHQHLPLRRPPPASRGRQRRSLKISAAWSIRTSRPHLHPLRLLLHLSGPSLQRQALTT